MISMSRQEILGEITRVKKMIKALGTCPQSQYDALKEEISELEELLLKELERGK